MSWLIRMKIIRHANRHIKTNITPSQNKRDNSSPALLVSNVIRPLTEMTIMPITTKKNFVRKAIRSFMASNSDMNWPKSRFLPNYSMSFLWYVFRNSLLERIKLVALHNKYRIFSKQLPHYVSLWFFKPLINLIYTIIYFIPHLIHPKPHHIPAQLV